MKLPSIKPSSNAFMVFSMLLLGVSAAAAVTIFDFWFGAERSLSSAIFRKLSEAEVPMVWFASVLGLTLMAAGFIFYLCSFFLLATPAFFVRKFLQHKPTSDKNIFMYVSEKALTRVLTPEIAEQMNRRFRDAFIYMLLTSTETTNSANVRFVFTQLMFARSIGGILVVFSAYACWVLSVSAVVAATIVLATYAAACLLYMVGLNFYEDVMASGYLIEALHDAHQGRTDKVREKSEAA